MLRLALCTLLGLAAAACDKGNTPSSPSDLSMMQAPADLSSVGSVDMAKGGVPTINLKCGGAACVH